MARPSIRQLRLHDDQRRREWPMQIAVMGIDLGKKSCSVVGLDSGGRIILRRRVNRDALIQLASRLPACVMAMEACCGAHHLGRILQAHGHQVRLMPPEYVQPYVKSQKNDERDAEAMPKRRRDRQCGLSNSRARPSSICRLCTGPARG